MGGKSEVLWSFILDYTKGWGVREHEHDYFQMYYCVSGQGVLYVDGEPKPLQENWCLIIHPFQKHELLPMPEGRMRIIDTKFHVHDKQLRQELMSLPQLLEIENSQFKKLQDGVRNEWVSSGVHARDLANLLFEQSLYLYLRQQEQEKVEHPLYRYPEEAVSRLTGLARTVADYVLDHYQETISLDGMASELRYSKNHLCKVFKEASGLTIVDFTNQLRVGKAYELIRYTDQKLSDISHSCGFASIHYFSRVFHRITGLVPSDVRDSDRLNRETDIRLHGSFHFRYFQEQP